MAVSFTMFDWEVLKSLGLQFVQLNQIASIATYCGSDDNNCALLLTESGKVFAIGKSSRGCLGLGEVTETAEPVELVEVSGVAGVCVCGYRGDALAYTSEGKVYVFGNNVSWKRPQLVPELTDVVDARCRAGHYLALTKSGKLYEWRGVNTSINALSTTPKVVTLNEVITFIACGPYHSLALTKDGQVYSWGKKYNSRNYVDQPMTQILLPETVAKFLTMDNNLMPEDTKQECCKVIIKEEVIFELIEEQACVDGMEEKSGVINIIKEEKGCLDEKHDQSFTSHILKEENISVNQIKKEDLNIIDVNKEEEFIKDEEEFDYIWPEDALKETDPLALPEIKCENEFPNTKEGSVSVCDSSNRKDSECKFASSPSFHLKVHMAKNTGEQPYKCNLCEFVSSTSSNIKRHMAKHTGEQPYKCNLCEYASFTSSHLKRHIRKHTGERPYKM